MGNIGQIDEHENIMISKLREMRSVPRNAIASGFLLVSCLISSISYTTSFLWLFKREVSYLPDLASGLISILLIWPLIRGDFLYGHKVTPHALVNLVLIFYLTAAFVTIGLGGDNALLKGPTFIFTAIVIVLANLNASRYGELAIIALAIFGGMNLFSASNAMGFYGFLLAACSALGVLFAVDIEKAVALLVRREGSPRV